jgi:uncharacterized protein (DUF342 family)
MLEKIALKQKLISKEDCRKAMEWCSSSKDYEAALKEYFISQNLINEQTIAKLIQTIDAMRIMRATMKFGAVAVEMGLLNNESLQTALKGQKEDASANKQLKRIGQILLDSGELTKEQIGQVIKEQKKRNAQSQVKSPIVDQDDKNKKSGSKSDKNTGQEIKDPVSEKESISEPEPVLEKLQIKSNTSEKIEGGIVLDIEDNCMFAYLRKTKIFDSSLTADDLYSILLEKQVQYGIVNEKSIEGFINSSGFKENRFKVASGILPITGKDARIEYHFDTDPLKAGDFDTEGNIDFKDRGELPRIEANTILAEKFAFKESSNGKDVFGNELIAEPARDLILKCSTGAVMSEDGMKVSSQVSGSPRLSMSGNISVNDSCIVKGDVSYKTGHLFYDGNIEVHGCLKSGFQINGFDIKVKEIEGGQIYANGDVTIFDGVNGAKIFSRGHVSAKFVHNSEISCLGNITVEKEIVDSTIESSGVTKTMNGEIINSIVTSNLGLYAKSIGTDKTKPNIISVGSDAFIINELSNIENKIIEFEKERFQLEKKHQTLLQENKTRQEATSQTANELDKALEEKFMFEKALIVLENPPEDTPENSSDKPDVKEKKILALTRSLKQTELLINRLDGDLNNRFNIIEKNATRVEQILETYDDLEDKIDDLNQEKQYFTKWSKSNIGKSIVFATGKICSGTIIKGKHSQKEIAEAVNNVQVREVSLTNSTDETNIFEIQIHDKIK